MENETVSKFVDIFLSRWARIVCWYVRNRNCLTGLGWAGVRIVTLNCLYPCFSHSKQKIKRIVHKQGR